MQDLKKTTALKSINRAFEAAYLGNFDFRKSVRLQEDLLQLALQTNCNFVIGLEHPAVLTLGHRAEAALEVLSQSNLPIERVSRGGLATVHSEGQLVIYPVLNLRELNLGVREYVCLLLKTTNELLTELGVDSAIDEKAVGVFTKTGKIVFCGVQVKNGVSQHGISLNVRNDLSLFKSIRSCGIAEPSFDRLCEYDVNMTLQEIFSRWLEIFRSRL